MGRKRTSLMDVAIYVGFIIVLISMLYPLLLIMGMSFSSPGAVMSGKVILWPVGWNLNNYRYVAGDPEILRDYFNTIYYAALSLVLTLLFTAMTAYPLSLPRFKYKDVFTFYITVPMFISGGLIPYYTVVQQLHLINTAWAVVLPCVSAINVIIFREFFKENLFLNEAAYIDGAGEWTILFRIIVPLTAPVFATIGLFTVVGQWNSFLPALLFLDDASKQPLQMYIRKLIVTMELSQTNPMLLQDLSGLISVRSVRAAAIVVTILPILAAYPFAQKYFIKGVKIGAIKG